VTKYKVDIIINQSEIKAILVLIKTSVPQTPVISVIHTDPAAAIKAVQDGWDYWKIQYGIIKFSLLSPYLFLRRLYQTYTRKKYTESKHLYYYNHSNATVLLSDKFFDSFKGLIGIKDFSKLHAISNPTTDIITTDNNKENIVLFVGRLVFQKRLDRLFGAWNRIKDKKDWRLIIVGDGPDRDLYESICKKWAVEKVEFVGQSDPTPYYHKAKILCMSSSFEGSPCVIQEAMLHNVLPIAYKSFESIDDIISNGIDGFTIKPFSISDYSKALKRLMIDPSYREQTLGNIKQRNTRDIYSIDKIIVQWEELFKELTIKE
jgi:glycosyltransferase involved in cell wall biosynthesis